MGLNWTQIAALVAAGAATAATAGAAAPALAGAAGAGAGAAGAGTAAAGTGGLLGAGTAAGTGAASTGGLLGAATSTGATTGAATAGAGAGSTAGTTIGGLLGNPGTAATYGTGLGTQQTSMLAAQEAGMAGTTNYLGGASKLATEAKPFMQAASTGMQASQAMQPEPPPAAPVLSQNQSVGPQTLGQLVSEMKNVQGQQLQAAEAERRARRSRGLLGG